MKKRAMRVIKRALSIAILSVAQNGYSGDAEVLLTTDNPTIYPYEPVTAVTCVSNQSDTALIDKEGFRSSFRYRAGTNGAWKVIGVYGYGSVPMLYPREYKLESHKTIGCFATLDIDAHGKHIFDKPGDYYIQYGTVFGESAPLTITVKEPESSESKLIKEVGDKRLYLWFMEDTARQCSYFDNMDEALNNLQTFAGKHPESRYGAWAKLGSLFVEKHKNKIAVERGNPPSQREHCWYEVSHIASGLGDAELAEKAMKEVRKVRKDVYFEEKSKW
jgi:hypothetical protein